MSNTLNQTILCQEIFDDNSHPSEKEIFDYAIKIGIDPKTEQHLLPIARDGLMQALPPGWKPCYDSSLERYYYYNIDSGFSQWEHPLDSVYKEKVRRGRSEGYSSAASLIVNSGEDDSKTTAKEDLRSFEEVSDILSSRSFDSKVMRRGSQHSLSNVPSEDINKPAMLARRKMNQMRHDSLPSPTQPITVETSKLITQPGSGFHSGGWSDEVGSHLEEKMKLAKQRLTPMRRSQTLDEVPRRQGILRESPSEQPPPRRLAPISGPFGWNEAEDEKKSVRFADLERKTLDIKFDFSGSDESDDDIDTDSSVDGQDVKNSLGLKVGLTKSESKSSVDSEKTVESSNSGGSGEKTRRGGAKSMDTSSDSAGKQGADKSDETSVSQEQLLLIAPEKKDTRNIVKDDVDNRNLSPETDVQLVRIEATKNKLMSEKLDALEKQLTEQLEQKIAALNDEMNTNLTNARMSISKKETNEIVKMRDEHQKKINDLKATLEDEIKTKEKSLREEKEAELTTLLEELESEKKRKLSEERSVMDKELEKLKETHRKSISDQEATTETLMREKINHSDQLFNERLSAIKVKEEEEVSKRQAEYDETVKQLQNNFNESVKEMELKYQKELEKVEEEQLKSLHQLQSDKEGELRRVEAEWQDKITAAASQHKIILESAIEDHDKKMLALKSHFHKEEEDIKKKHADQLEAWNIRVQKMADKEQNDLSQISREFEKMRCEKRLLEDKYRSLKDKYIQMKSEMRLAIERRLQRKKRAQAVAAEAGKITVRVEHSPNNNTEIEEAIKERRHAWVTNNNSGGLEPPTLDNDPSSADEMFTSTSTTLDSESKKIREEVSKKPMAALDNIKSQLLELDYLGEPSRVPDTYLRYPFSGEGGGSAEIDFYKHRVVVEQEAVRQARECLAQQKRDLEARQMMLRAAAASADTGTLSALHQQERDLTEMEVSLHRTRALLGEKMIRLRLLGQTLGRIDPSPSPGEKIVNHTLGETHSQCLENLDNINAEIREIWAALDGRASLQPSTGGANLVERQMEAQINVRPTSLGLPARADLEAKLANMKQWLQVTSKRASLTL